MDFKSMSLEELKQLQIDLAAEITQRTAKEKPLALYTHDCKGRAKHHLGKYKHWAKLVTAIDTTKTNGYAFKGDWLEVRNEHKIPVGSIVVEVCGTCLTAYRITADEKEEIESANTKSLSGLIERLADLI